MPDQGDAHNAFNRLGFSVTAVILGGETDIGDRYIAPTVVKDVPGDDSLMSE